MRWLGSKFTYIIGLILGYVAAFRWGRQRAKTKAEKARRKAAEADAKHWQNIGAMSNDDIADKLRDE
jgi:hypothetical protein